ncbi:MAG: hypothetical protein ACYTHM_25660, partial [Planctomycetota bacterium]
RYIKKTKDGSEGRFTFRFDEDGKCTKIRATVFARDEHEWKFVRFNRPALLHESTHLLLQRYMGKHPVPVWLGEGLATYFQFWDLKKEIFHNTTGRYARSSLLLAYLKSRKTEKREGHPLDRLFAFTKKTWNPDRMGPKAKADYGLAESFIDTLFTSDEGEALLRALLAQLIEFHPGDELFSSRQMERVKALWEEQIAFLEEEMLPQER